MHQAAVSPEVMFGAAGEPHVVYMVYIRSLDNNKCDKNSLFSVNVPLISI